jgi:lipopolysaccharide transport system permease protein
MMMAYYGFAPHLGILLVPLLVLLMIGVVLGVGILLAALTVAYRDFRNLVPFTIQLWMFATPAIYLPADLAIGPAGNAILAVNPAQGVIENFRSAVLGGPLNFQSLAVSGAIGITLLVVGLLYFRRVENSFADVI